MDRIESGQVSGNPPAIARGPNAAAPRRITCISAGRPLFLFGTDDWVYVFDTARETPLQWRRNMQQRRDLGVSDLREISNLACRARERSERLWRKVDGIVAIGPAVWPSLLRRFVVGYQHRSSDAELALGQQFCREFAAPICGRSRLIYYSTGIIALRVERGGVGAVERVPCRRLRFHGEVREAWGTEAPTEEIGSIPAQGFQRLGHDWAT